MPSEAIVFLLTSAKFRSNSLNINHAGELALSTLCRVLRVHRETGTRIVHRVDKDTSGRAGRCAARDIAQQEASVSITPFASETDLEPVLECEVKSLCGEVANHIRTVASPEGAQTFFPLKSAVANDDAR